MAAVWGMWGESSGSDTDESGSSYNSEDSNASQSGRMESARILGETFHFPQGMCDNPEILKEMLSLETFDGFTNDQKRHLENFLPNFEDNDGEEKRRALEMLLGGENVRFGNPLTEFSAQLQAGNYRPDIVRMRSLLRKAQIKDYKRSERWRIFELLKSLLSSRQRLVDAVVNGEKIKPCPPPAKKPRTSKFSQNVKSRYFQELSLIKEEVGETDQSSEDESYPAGPSLPQMKKMRRASNVAEILDIAPAAPVLGTLWTTPTPWDSSGKCQHNPYAVPEQSYSHILAQHTKRRANREDHPDLHTEGISLQDVALRCKFLKKPSLKPVVVPKKIKMKIARTTSVSSPAVDDEIDETTDIEDIVKKEEEEEESKVDIEALDELPLPPIQAPSHLMHNFHKSPASSNSHHNSLTKHHQISANSGTSSKITNLLLNKKIKMEPHEPLAKKCLALGEPEFKKARSDSTESRKSKTDVIDSFMKKLKPEPDSLSSKRVKVEPVEMSLPTLPTLPPVTTVKLETKPPAPVCSPMTPVIASTHPAPVPTPSVFSPAPIKTSSSTMTRILTPATLSDLDGYDMMDLPIDFDETPPVDLEDIKPHPELMQETQACFFALIRDILLSTPDHRIEMKELEFRVKAWASSPIGPINSWYTPHLESQLASAVLFLAGDLTESLPEDYVPYMEWKSNVGAYQWIGAGRDSDHRLTTLCNQWLERNSSRHVNVRVSTPVLTSSVGTNVVVTAAPTVAVTTTATTTTSTSTSTTIPQLLIEPDLPPRGPAVRPTSPKRREQFRIQEKHRYESPYRAFSYNLGGAECTVGPVRSMQQGNLSKARGHTLLVEDRPKHVTILELVRDAVARLPNAQGTRADIVTLLKDSQYLVDSAPEAMLSSVVSSALDRLHYEHDPIVKYDTKRKIWMYLHKGRSPDEHERLHALGVDVKVSRPKNPRKPPKPKKEPITKTTTSTVSTVIDSSSLIEVPVSVTDSSTSTSSTTVAVTSSSVPLISSSLLVQAKPKTALKTTSVGPPVRKVTAEGVKTLLGKTKLKLQESTVTLTTQQQISRLQSTSAIPHTTTASVATSPKKTLELVKATPTSIVTARTVLQDASSTPVSTSSIKPLPQTLTKKVGNQTVTLTTEQAGKTAGKSIVKVITSQGTTPNVRTVQRLNQQVSQQQILQLKQQLMGDQTNLLQKAQLKKGVTGPQQLLVRMQGEQGGTSQGQVIVINQQQILVDSPQLAQQLKQQPKQLQQLLSKQQVTQVDQQVQSSGAATQTSGTTTNVQKMTPHQQQQLNQLILNKQQQILIGDQKSTKGQQQMILMKQQTQSSTGDGSKPQVQQMILAVKPGADGEGTQITSQQLHQMIVLNKQQNQQQIYMVKPDQKSLQVITQQPIKMQAQQLTLAQIQQIQQQQRSSGTPSILNTSRVVAQVSNAPVSTVAGTALLKPQVVTGSGTQMVAKVVTSSQTPVLTMENILAQHKQQTVTQQAGVRLPTVSRALTSQYVVSLPQTRVVQTTMQQVVATTSTGVMAVTSVGASDGTKITTTAQGVRIPGLNLANIAGKQVLLASKPAVGGGVQGQNVLLGGASGGQALLVGGNQQGTVTVLQGSQQILLPPGVVKTIQNLKVIPLAQGKPNQAQAGRHQMIARISNMRPVLATNIVQDPASSQPQPSLQLPTSSSHSKD